MLPIPVAAIHLHQRCVGQQIDGTFKQMDGIASRCRDTEREPLVAPAGIATEISAQAAEVGIPGLLYLSSPTKTAL